MSHNRLLKGFISCMVISIINVSGCSSDNDTAERVHEHQLNTKADNNAYDNPQQFKQNLIQINTPRGSVSLPTNPHPLAVYDFTVLQNLLALGVSIEAIPENSELTETSKQKLVDAKRVGTVFEPDLEELHLLNPKAIIIGNRMAKKYSEINAIAPTLDFSVSFNNLYASSQHQLEQLGLLFDKSDQASRLQADIDAAINKTSNMTKNKGNGLVISVKGNKITTFGLNSRYGYLYKDFGIPIADSSIGSYTHGQPISFEYIRQVNPDWIFLLEYHSATGTEGKNAYAVLDNALIHQTKAWQQQNIVYLSKDSYIAFGSYDHWINDAKRIQTAFKDAPIIE